MYLTFSPQPPLDQYISCYWTIRASRPSDACLEEVIVPDSNSDLLFCLNSSRVRSTKEQETAGVRLATCLDVARTKPIQVQLVGSVDVVGVRFRLGGLSAFQSTSPRELTGGAVGVTDVFGSAISLLEERLAETRLPHERIALLDEFLVTQLSPQPRHRLIGRVIEMFRRPGGQQPLSKVADDIGCSVRTIRRAFRRLVGRSPKVCARLLRFHGAWQSIATHSRRSWTAIAYEWGYYDQSHFIREFRSFTGMTPTEYEAWLHRRIRTEQSGWGGAMSPAEYRSWLARRACAPDQSGRYLQSVHMHEA